ncbi:MAG: metalloenzyme [bacterium]
MIFIDGIGIGEYDEEKNPFARFPSLYFSKFINQYSQPPPFAGCIVPTDPSMGVPGLPQSATGQTALLTGVNASKVLGRHQSGFPTPTLRKLFKEESIFFKLEKMNKVGTFANAFTPEYFARPDRQISATTWSVKASKFPFRMVHHELVSGQVISHDLTNEFLFTMGHRVPIRKPETSAEILVAIAESVDFCLFEFILLDVIGHQQDMVWAESELKKLNHFLNTVLNQIDLDHHLVLVTSDHGNFEDLSISTHTHNLVPTILWGKDRNKIAKKIKRIEDVPRAILSYIQEM